MANQTPADGCEVQDYAGYDLSMNDPKAVAAWNSMVTAFLAHGASTPEHLGEVLTREPDFAIGHATRGLFYALLARRELDPAIDAAWRAGARIVEAGADARTRGFVEALGACRLGDFTRAVEILGRVQAAYPKDALAMKLGHALRFILGDARGMRRALEGAEAAFGADHPHYGYLLGCRAFAMEETGDYANAERLGRRGLEIAPDDAWGLHAVAHVHDMTGRAEEGVRWLSGKSARWEHCNNFGYHVWWHLALFYLDKGATTLALELYDERVRPTRTDDFRDIANGASLLIRLEI
jgi:tetratricopeptide (TPR) repeat protein